MLRIHRQHGFASLVEVIVTAMIFLLAAFGIFASISMLRPQGQDVARRLEAAYIGRSILEELRGEVDARTWNSTGSLIYPGQYSRPVGDYTVFWTISEVPNLGIREVTMNIFYENP